MILKGKTLKIIAWLALVIIAIGILTGLFLFFKPHRNVQKEKVFAEMNIKDLLNEFMTDQAKANAKYLSSDGNSKVLVVEGRVQSLKTNQHNDIVILLREAMAKVGVSCSFTRQTNPHTLGIKQGDIIKVKGAIIVGNTYDKDIDLYTNAILVQCDIAR